MNVREECPSPLTNLAEMALLHHYRCAYHGPEDESALAFISYARNAATASLPPAATTSGPGRR